MHEDKQEAKRSLMEIVAGWESQDKEAFIEELLDLITEEQVEEILARQLG